MLVSPSLQRARWVALLLPAMLLGGAYLSQYGFGLYPCEMCWWQRYPHFAAICFGLLAFVNAGRLTLWASLAAVALAVSGCIGGFHAGVEYGWWQGFTACTSLVSKEGDTLAAIFEAPLVRCDVAPWSLLGVSLAGWNCLISLLGAGYIVVSLRASGKGLA